MRLTTLFKELMENERTGGLLLVLCTAISLLLANSAWSDGYLGIWHAPVAGQNVEFWINDGLMAIFFLMVGLELRNEIKNGELSDRKKAFLPLAGALGGMIVPALIHMTFNHGGPTASGAGIPMATDIAFAIGILSLLGDRVPLPLKVFLMALAVIDDLGAIVVIALFYSSGLDWALLGGAAVAFVILLGMARAKVNRLLPYLLVGGVMWYLMLHSGVHATVAGVLLAFAIPAGTGSGSTPSERLLRFLHRPVPFIILPLFALANTGIVLGNDWFGHLFTTNGYGIFLGLVVGKPIGITLFSFIAVSLGLCALPTGIRWPKMVGVGLLGGIGFTMSIFITLLAFDDPALIVESKTTILISSLVAGIMGYLVLHTMLPRGAWAHTGKA